MIRTGAVTATPKALFEGGESFALSEERKLLHSLRQRQRLTRPLLRTNIPDRSHLVREAARTLWISLTWHLTFFTSLTSSADRDDHSSSATKLTQIDEAHLPDGETSDLPNSSTSASDATRFFKLLSSAALSNSTSERNKGSRAPYPSSQRDLTGEESDQSLLGQMHEQDERSILYRLALIIHHWTRIRTLRTSFTQPEIVPASKGSTAKLITSCREALVEVQALTATSDVELSIFQPLITLVKVDATLLLALHLLAQSRSNEYNDSHKWHEIRSAVATSLLLVWTPTTASARLGSSQTWRKSVRQLIEQVLLESFSRKRASREEQVRIKNEDEDMPAVNIDDRLDQNLGPLSDDDPLRVYQEELLAEDPIYKYGSFFEILDGEYAQSWHRLKQYTDTHLCRYRILLVFVKPDTDHANVETI